MRSLIVNIKLYLILTFSITLLAVTSDCNFIISKLYFRATKYKNKSL